MSATLLAAGLAMATALEEYIGACGNGPPDCEGCEDCQPARDALVAWACAVVRDRNEFERPRYVADFIDQARDVVERAKELVGRPSPSPVRAVVFANDVIEQTLDMVRRVKATDLVTETMWDAIDDLSAGLSRWNA